MAATNAVNPPPASTTGINWLDGLINTATGIATSWMQYDSYDNYIKFQQQQAQNSLPLQGTVQQGVGINSQSILMWGLLGIGAVVVYKALK